MILLSAVNSQKGLFSMILQSSALKIKKPQNQKSKLYDFAICSQFSKRIIFNDPAKLRFENQKVTKSKKQAS